eukprot:scaffold17203_cov20-Tisochrysis_lutea.AAC.4
MQWIIAFAAIIEGTPIYADESGTEYLYLNGRPACVLDGMTNYANSARNKQHPHTSTHSPMQTLHQYHASYKPWHYPTSSASSTGTPLRLIIDATVDFPIPICAEVRKLFFPG